MKRRLVGSNFALIKCKERSNPSEDLGISRLHDDLLIRILCLLSTKEAARTSVLSTRWKKLWTYRTGTYNFDAFNVLKRTSSWVRLQAERSNFVNWVNRVLMSHKGATMLELRVHFDLDSCFTSDINNWIQFATHKSIKTLDLNLRRLYDIGPRYSLSLQPMDFLGLKSLTAIYFKYVDVNGECLECLLSCCPFLEELYIDDSTSLVNLRACSQSLKRLKIAHCWRLENIEISAINLVSFEYVGPNINLCFKRADALSKLSVLSNYISQLHTLVLELDSRTFINFPKFPELRNLKQLTLKVDPCAITSFLPCIALIEAAPCLFRFRMEVLPRNIAFFQSYLLQPNVIQTAKNRPLKSPKVIEFDRFIDCKVDVEFALYLIENVVSLEKIFVYTRPPKLIGSESMIIKDENEIASKMFAMVLETKLPPAVQLVVL